MKGKAPASTFEVNLETLTDSPKNSGAGCDKGYNTFNEGGNIKHLNSKFEFLAFNWMDIKIRLQNVILSILSHS